MTLVRFKPFNEFESALDRFFEPFGGFREPEQSRTWSPAVDIQETEESLQFHMDLPGLTKDEIFISVDEGLLTVSAERKNGDAKEYLRRERWLGKVQRSFRLPTSVDPEKIEAKLKDGVLTLTVPKRAEARRREIAVQVS